MIGFVCVWARLLLYLISLRRPQESEPVEETEAAAEPEQRASMGLARQRTAVAGAATE